MSRSFSLYILIGMILGIGTGWAINAYLPTETAAQWADGFKVVTDIFLRLIKMIIAPLVFSTLVAGIAHMGSGSAIGRIGLRTMAWFLGASLLSLSLGIVAVTILQPGAGLNLPLPAADAQSGIKASALSFKDFLTHVFPKSFFEAMATNEILQILIFSCFFGFAIVKVGKAPAITTFVTELVDVMLKVTDFVMWVAPAGVFGAVAAAITTQGLGILATYAKFIGAFYLGILILWGLLVAAGFVFLGPQVFRLMKTVREPLIVAFTTASSEAAYPKLMEQLDRFGVNPKVTALTLPLGYSFNLDGSMLYQAFAALFIAQAYGIELSFAQQLTLLLVMMVSSKGVAGVPRASLVVVAAVLPTFGLPEAGLLLIMGIDQFLDMGRTATNVIGNSIATAVVAKWEGQLGEPVADSATRPMGTHGAVG